LGESSREWAVKTGEEKEKRTAVLIRIRERRGFVQEEKEEQKPVRSRGAVWVVTVWWEGSP